MPIRFRCAYCNQLMGIAKRKAGQVVTCPKCGGQVVVPTPDPSQEEEEPKPGSPGAVFEEDDEVQRLLEYVEETERPPPTAQPAGARKPAPAAPMPQPRPPMAHPLPAAPRVPAAEVQLDVVPVGGDEPLPPPGGVHLSPGVLAIVLTLAGLTLGLMFLLGFLVGRSTV
jgi:hypothetical protein